MGLYNIFQFITIKNLSPNHALITQIMLAFYCSIMSVLNTKMEKQTCFISIAVHSLCIFILLIFLEIIEIKCCGLDRDTAHNIINRAFKDKNLSSFSEESYGIEIGNNVNIGWDVMIMPGVTIGDNVVIGCGAIITKDVPSNTVVAGIPSRVIETIDDYARKNVDKVVNTKNLSKKENRSLLQKTIR